MKIILASASERRKELLERITKEFEIIVSEFDESNVLYNNRIEEYVEELAYKKAESVSYNCDEDSLIIGCDTIVFHKDKILGKPKDKEEAFNMLISLSGDYHFVYTGVAIINNKSKEISKFNVSSKVLFSTLAEDEILSYIDSGEPMDKAGSYGIQGLGGVFVEEIQGCYYNIVGLPINKLHRVLKDIGAIS
ncbi:MAG: Maf-like protein [Clostridiaceae bacterium]